MKQGGQRSSFVDLLDRLLDRGVYLQADLIVTVAGVPLLGARLNALLGGIETLVSYGVFRDWDEAIRTQSREPLRAALLELPASVWGVATTGRKWVSGTLAVAREGLVLRDETGVERMAVPYGGVRHATLTARTDGLCKEAVCLRLQVSREELWLHVHHVKSLVSVLTGQGIEVSAAS